MKLSAERLNASRDDITTIIRAFESEDASDISATGHNLVAELVELDDADWHPVLEGLEDDGLREQVARLRQILTEKMAAIGGQEGLAEAMRHIRQVVHTVSFDVSRPSLAINLTLKAGNQTLDTRADLEDTLWAGSAIVQVVRETMRSMGAVLNLPAQRACIGSNFEDNLAQAEAAIAEIRQRYEAASKTGALD